MTTISKKADIVTLINVFTVAPENQQKLVDLLIEATEKTMKHCAGFVSANLHKSADGVRVTNYAQWRSREDYQAMLADAAATAHMKPITDIATFDAHLYEVVETLSIS